MYKDVTRTHEIEPWGEAGQSSYSLEYRRIRGDLREVYKMRGWTESFIQ